MGLRAQFAQKWWDSCAVCIHPFGKADADSISVIAFLYPIAHRQSRITDTNKIGLHRQIIVQKLRCDVRGNQLAQLLFDAFFVTVSFPKQRPFNQNPCGNRAFIKIVGILQFFSILTYLAPLKC